LLDWRDHGQKPNLRGGGDGGGSNPWSSSTPDFSITTCARSPAGRGRAIFGWGAGVGVGTATARSGEGETSDDAPRSSARSAGVFAGFGVSSSSRASLVFPLVLDFPAVSFSRDFFLAAFGLGVGVWCRFDLGKALGSGVSRGVAEGFVSPVSADSLTGRGVGDFLGFAEGSVSFCNSSLTGLARGIAVDASSGVAEARCFFADLVLAPFALGVGDFFGLGDEALVSLDSDSSRRLFCSSLTCARRMPVTIAPTASAVASQMRKRTTATERNRARDVINGIVKKVARLQSYNGNLPF
jgi:hypothetical protein